MGIDLVLPDFTYLREHVDDIEAIVITHGHEDHIGALPWVLRDLGETSGARDLRRPADGRHGRAPSSTSTGCARPSSRCSRRARRCQAGPFEIELVHLTHSIPDMVGVILRCELGTVLFTGDYKFDQTPVGGAPADVSRLAELGRDGVLLLCGDSTNADRPGIVGQRVDGRPEPRARLRALQGPDRRHELRLEHPPRAAGHRRRRRARPQGLPGRALDAQERQHRAHARPHRRAGGDAHPAARARPTGPTTAS